jgi:hypothetical protein
MRFDDDSPLGTGKKTVFALPFPNLNYGISPSFVISRFYQTAPKKNPKAPTSLGVQQGVLQVPNNTTNSPAGCQRSQWCNNVCLSFIAMPNSVK